MVLKWYIVESKLKLHIILMHMQLIRMTQNGFGMMYCWITQECAVTQFSWNLLAPLPSKWHPQWAQSLTITKLPPDEPLKIAQKPNHPLPTPNKKKFDLKLWSQNFNNNIKSRNTCMRNIKGMRLPISTLLEYYDIVWSISDLT